MGLVKFGDYVKEVKINIDRNNNPYEYYVAGDHMDSEDLTIRRKGLFATDDVGPAFTRLFKPGQILYGSRRTYLKKVAVADFEGICSNTTFVLETKDENKLRQRLLPFIMLTDDFTKWSISKSKGSTNPYILFSDLANYEFELPDINRQDELVDLLWQAYATKESYREMIRATDEMVKSQFIEMFGNQLEYQKSSHEKVRDYCDVVSGYPFNSELFNKDRQGSPLIRIRDVARGYTETYTTEVCDNRFEVNAGDLLVGMDGIFDIAPWASETALLNQRVCMVKPNNERVSAAFIKYAVHPVLKQIEGNTDATTVKHISAAQIADIRLPLINECKINEFTRVAQRADKSKYLS